jgi:hypothetical protein
MKVDKREFAREHENKSYMKVDESWHARVCMHESFLNSRVPIKREQELHESWWKLTCKSLHESFLNAHVPFKREQELHESW